MLTDIKFLDRVIGEKKEMYLAILEHIASGFTEEETAIIFNLTPGRISQIFKANRQLCNELTLNVDLAKKAGQLRYAFKKLHKKETNGSTKDSLDWLQLVINLTKEDKFLIDNSTHYHFDLKQGEKIVAEARRRGIPIPETLARRFGDTAQVG
jgi:hypothetical protein